MRCENKLQILITKLQKIYLFIKVAFAHTFKYVHVVDIEFLQIVDGLENTLYNFDP